MSITICIAERLQKPEPYYAGIGQEYRSYGEYSLPPCMQDSIPEIQHLVECCGVDQLWGVRLGRNCDNVAEFLFKGFSFPYLGQVSGVFGIQKFGFLFSVSLCTDIDVTAYLPTGPFASLVQAILRRGYRQRTESRAG